MGGAGAAGGVVPGFVCASTEGADDGALADRASGDGVVEGVASVAATKDGECRVFLDGGGASEEGGWILDKLDEPGPIGVDEGEGDGGVTFLRRDGVVEPLGRVDEGESFAGGVAGEFSDEGHRG